MSEEARAMPKPGKTLRALTTIHNQRERATKVADREAEKSLRNFIQRETEGAGKDEKDVFSQDIAALQRVFPDILEAIELSKSSGRLADYLGPIERPPRMVAGIEHFIGGLSIASQALEQPILAISGSVNVRIEPYQNREEAIRGYYASAAMLGAMREGPIDQASVQS